MEKWVNVKDKLPEVNTIVKVITICDTETFDFVNEPLDPKCPFQHFIVNKWRIATREELNELLMRGV